jgi:hypothetical protein
MFENMSYKNIEWYIFLWFFKSLKALLLACDNDNDVPEISICSQMCIALRSL